MGSLRVAFNPDGMRIASASEDHTIKLGMSAGQEASSFAGRCIAFSPNGTRIPQKVTII